MNEEEAVDLCKLILAADDSILSVGIITHTGEPIGGATSDALRSKFPNEKHWEEGAFRKYWRAEAFRVAMTFASANADDRLLSPLESVVLVREQMNMVLMIITEEIPLIIGAVVKKSANSAKITEEISQIFQSRSASLGNTSSPREDIDTEIPTLN